jgi:UDPglucose 6-dehydrogenase
MKLTVIGCGRLGTAHAACMAEIGHDILGVDTDDDRVKLLNGGRAPFHEPGLDELLARNISSGRLRFTSSFEDAVAFAGVHFLVVPTPGLPDEDGCDLSAVFAAGRSLAQYLDHPALIIGKSTVPPGTCEALERDLMTRTPAADTIDVAWNPEFIRAGHAVNDTLSPDRIVAGTSSAAAQTVIREIYRPLTDAGVPLVLTDPATAELAKGAANAFLATKISFINAMADMCLRSGADVTALAEVLGLDPRIGRAGLTAGLGYGGGCLPEDVRGLAAFAASVGADQAAGLLSAVDEINNARRQQIVDLLVSTSGPLQGKRVAMWGAAFKPGTDDVRDSPGLDIADRLYRLGAEVLVYDPMATPNALIAFPHLGFADSALAAAHDAHAVLVVTAWPEFAAVNPAAAAAAAATPMLLDACHGINPGLWRTAGWTVVAPYSLPRSLPMAAPAPQPQPTAHP